MSIFFQNCIERHFPSSLEHHAKAFVTLVFFLLTTIMYPTTLFCLKSKQKWNRESDTFSAVIPFHAFHKYTKLASVSGAVEVSLNNSTEHCTLSGLKVQRYYAFIFSEFLIKSLQLLFPASLVLLTKNTNWGSVQQMLSHSKHLAQHFKYGEPVSNNKYVHDKNKNCSQAFF